MLNQLPFQKVRLESETLRVRLPNIGYFKHLIRTMPFANEFNEDILDAMLETFQTMCQRKYNDQLYYETRPIFLKALK